ncbi:MAG: peptide chain release factor 1 [Chloroflexi bacterium]|nr:peptide chain release factor 1 [Chloroflexota bacterium]
MRERLQAIERRYEELAELMARPEIATDPQRLQSLAREHASLEEVVARSRQYQATLRALEEAQALRDDAATDPELAELAREEVEHLQERSEAEWQALKLALLPADPNDQKEIIVEIRAGVGGEEAALWAADLYRMYTRYAEKKGWQVEVINTSESDTGGFKEIVFEIHGRGAYSRLKYESGPHRVQRVPATEAQGRIHTSTATVAVLPEVDEVELAINPNEIRMDIFHSGGAGGQNVNKVATAVRLTHLPTGIVVVCQDERSQLKNRTKAMAVLRARLLASAQQKQTDEVTQARRSQIGTGERAEKIRTYNFPQNRMTDHRINLTAHNLPGILDGELDEIIDAVATAQQARQLEEQLV